MIPTQELTDLLPMASNQRIRLLGGLMGLCLACAGAWAEGVNSTDNPDWKEEAVPPPPAFAKDRLIALDMPSFVSLKVGIDPDTIVVGGDGVVRYVVVMTNATGTVNAAYEGIRCFTDDVNTYARWTSSGTWSIASDPQWKALSDNMPSQHAKAFSRQGGCQTRSAPTKTEILNALKFGKKTSGSALTK